MTNTNVLLDSAAAEAIVDTEEAVDASVVAPGNGMAAAVVGERGSPPSKNGVP